MLGGGAGPVGVCCLLMAMDTTLRHHTWDTSQLCYISLVVCMQSQHAGHLAVMIGPWRIKKVGSLLYVCLMGLAKNNPGAWTSGPLKPHCGDSRPASPPHFRLDKLYLGQGYAAQASAVQKVGTPFVWCFTENNTLTAVSNGSLPMSSMPHTPSWI